MINIDTELLLQSLTSNYNTRPDPAPCSLFSKMMELLAGIKYTRVQDLSKAVKAVLWGVLKEGYLAAFDKWRRKLQLC